MPDDAEGGLFPYRERDLTGKGRPPRRRFSGRYDGAADADRSFELPRASETARLPGFFFLLRKTKRGWEKTGFRPA